MKSDTALVWSYSRVELNSETSVYLYLAVVIYPRNTENDLSFRLNYSVDYTCLNKVRPLFYNRNEAFQYLIYCLEEFLFAGISLLNLLINAFKIRIVQSHY